MRKIHKEFLIKYIGGIISDSVYINITGVVA